MSKQKKAQKEENIEIPINQVQKISIKLKSLADLIQYIQVMLKNESKRLNLQTLKYNFQKQKKQPENGNMIALLSSYGQFECFEQYIGLINDNTIKKLQKISKEVQNLRLQANRIHSDLKTKAKKNNSQAYNILSANSQKIDIILIKVWSIQYYMILNYRLDIACKEVQRWSRVNQQKVNEEKIKQQIDELFK